MGCWGPRVITVDTQNHPRVALVKFGVGQIQPTQLGPSSPLRRKPPGVKGTAQTHHPA